MTITDEQILSVLDLTTHAPTGDEYPCNQREGIDIFLGKNCELIEKVREILQTDQLRHARPQTHTGVDCPWGW